MICDVFLALGSNLGNREVNLFGAVESLSHLAGTTVKNVSNIYETEPVGYKEQGLFLNMAVEILTGLSPLCLLGELQKVENSLKRTREIRWGPRTIDIDILLFGDKKVDLPKLSIPHPRMFERAFMLVPLRDIRPEKEIDGRNIDELIGKCNDKNSIKLYRKCRLVNENGKFQIY